MNVRNMSANESLDLMEAVQGVNGLLVGNSEERNASKTRIISTSVAGRSIARRSSEAKPLEVRL